MNLTLAMLIPIYQIIVPIFCLLMLIVIWVRHRSGEFNMRSMIFWNVIWIGLAIFAIFPDLASKIAEITGIKDSFRALTIIALVSLFYLTFRNLSKIDQLSRELTRTIRESALKDQTAPPEKPKK